MASQDTRTTLEALPTEILQMILSETDCTDDLSAAIRAGPRLLQSFLGQREQILIRVIELSLHPRVFMEVLGLLHVPDYRNLHYVPDQHDAAMLGMFNEGNSEEDRDIWWFLCRESAIGRLSNEFEKGHWKRLLVGPAPEPFPIPRIRKPVEQEQLAEFRRTVNSIVEIFGRLKRHMEQTYTSSSFPYRDLWVPGTSAYCEFGTVRGGLSDSYRLFMQGISLPEQKQFLRGLLRGKLRNSE